MKPETPLQEDVLYEGTQITLKLRKTRLDSGQLVNREIIWTPGAVVIVPVTARQEVRLIRQYRSAADKWLIELPAGTLNPGEDPNEAAPRELLEETGDKAATWHSLGGYYTVPSVFTEYLHLYLATDLTPGPNQLEFDEHIEVITRSWTDVISLIKTGEIEDAKTISGLVKAGMHLNLPFS